MTSFVQKKVPGGKLLQLEKNTTYSITGDFFCYPESAITEMEKILNDGHDIVENLSRLFSDSDNTIVGFTETDLYELYTQINE